MCYRTTHSIRFFNVVYCTTKGGYMERCIDIGIHITSTVVALKVLSGSFPLLFSGKDTKFCNSMISNLSLSSFFALEPSGQLPTVPSSSMVHKLNNLLPALRVNFIRALEIENLRLPR